jgi:micrococcal nuclease
MTKMHKYILILLLIGGFMGKITALESTNKTFIYNVASIEKVVDGDTVEMVLDLGFNIFYKVSVRIDGLDTPEKFTAEGRLVKGYAEKWFAEARGVILTSKELDKYGRVLGSVSKLSNGKQVDYGTELLKEGYARSYNGEKKVEWTAEQLKVIKEKLSPK